MTTVDDRHRNLAMSVVPHQPDSALVASVPEPSPEEGSVLVETLLVGICGTDLHILGSNRPGVAQRLVLGHEAVGRVLDAPTTSGFAPGQLVSGIVRRPCTECAACARGDWDFCSSGKYLEQGIRGADGFGRQRWRCEPAYLIPVPDRLGELGVLVEPMSVVCKAIEAAFYIARRVPARPARMLVTGAGPIGLLTAGAGMTAGLEVTVVDRMSSGVKVDLVKALGASYCDDLGSLPGNEHFDIVVECSGAAEVVAPAVGLLGQAGVMVLIAGPPIGMPVPNLLLRANAAMVGTINAGRRHYAEAVETLLRLDPQWLAGLLTRRVPLERWPDALLRGDDDVKVVVEFAAR